MAGFRKAKAEQAAIKMGVYGASGSGKTFTSLLMAEGLAKASGKRVAFVDTERGTDFYVKDVPARQVHPKAFDIDALYSRSLVEVLAAIRGLDQSVYGCVVLDSMTHLWEAARNAYAGKKNGAGQIPFHAWASIKRPYKEMMELLLSSPMHVIICGRQGNEYAEDDDGELKMVGHKMKAEGETPYEPHILIRMEGVRDHGATTYYAYVEKDRTGVLSGRAFPNPTFDTLCAPVLSLLGGTQAKMQTSDEAATADAEALGIEELERAKQSEALLSEWTAKMQLAKTKDELDAVSKQITPAIKKEMTPADVTALRERYQELLTKVR